ncbi:1-acyl-sn-glycerol-3-phosphate acyltransferase [Francisella halioticida]|uniref:1-acyl-sn-glycerol-3-phosphate acyltransferase n=1 Tax=Francisella halioticida TaxID=549298 RepID=A0ABN5AZC1_9GAMM|nr:lysophospholipid acyltransferase family protein [Francisella halioticida]ASG68885.1 1-acyl-sn-glycerol-3-phosphate acyltransferase [Francisella halioticida]BCD91874.1 1-acyl-sn-glycerol-3-phosphate acyltransferase [Francisella halioticida]
MKKLNKLYRALAQGFCFLTFSFGGAILGYIYFPFISLFIKDDQSRVKHAQHIISYVFRFFIGMVHHLRVIRFQFENIEKLQQAKGCILIANHPTLIDYVAIVSRLKLCDNIVKHSLWQNFFFRHVIETAGYIPNLNPEQTISELNNIIAQGRNLLVFPEGTRSKPGKPLDFKRGASQLAIRTKAKIRIIHIFCHPATLTKNSKWYNIPDSTPVFKVVVGDEIDSESFIKEANGLPSLAARRLTRYLQIALSQKDRL